MSPAQIVHGDFSEVAEVRPDSKRRVTLKRADITKRYRVYENALGEMILIPCVMIPASEMWLHENKEALSSVRRGLKEAGEGKLRKGPRFAKHADDSLEDD
jgi:hypothetical protein